MEYVNGSRVSQDERREQGKFQASMRILVGKPLERTNEKQFVKLYRLSTKAF